MCSFVRKNIMIQERRNILIACKRRHGNDNQPKLMKHIKTEIKNRQLKTNCAT